MKDSTKSTWIIVLLVAAVGIFAYSQFAGPSTLQTIIQTGGVSQETTTVSNSLLTGEAGTVTVKDYDRENNNRNTEIAGTWYVLDNGQLIVNNAAVTSVDTSVGSPLVFYGSGTTYYGDKNEYSLNGITTGTVSLDAHTIAAESGMTVAGYDNTASTALTADTDAENTADYMNFVMGSGQQEVYYAKLKNQDDQSLFKLKAICTFYPSNGNISDNKLVDADFTEVAIPLYLKNSVVSVNNDTETAFLTYYKHCYVYKAGTEETIDLSGWDYTKSFQFVVEAVSGVNPAKNEGNVFGATFLDAAYSLGNDGKIWYDFYTHDSNEYTNTVGMAETATSPQGLQVGLVIEAS